MNKELIKSIIIDQKDLLREKMRQEHLLPRSGIVSCVTHLKHPNVLLISGLRRAGKSFFAQLLVKNKEYSFLNFDDERLVNFTAADFNVVLECFYELNGEFDHILLDEPQNIKGWELFVNRMRNKYKLIITGSNANLLSVDMATHLTGRYSDFNLFPMSFSEFLVFKKCSLGETSVYSTKKRSIITSHFNEYLFGGGIFEYYQFGKEFVRNLFSSIIAKDINVRYGIKYPHVLEELAVFLINYFTSKVSLANLAENLNVKSPHTIKEYIGYLEKSFLFFQVQKFSYKLKEQLSAYKKLYCIDNGIVGSMIFNTSENSGRFLENLVAIELRRRSLQDNCELFYWDDYSVECDFIVKRSTKIIAVYQVCFELTPKNKKREFGGLIAAMKVFGLKEGYILTSSTEEEISENGFKIKVIPVWKWVLGREAI